MKAITIMQPYATLIMLGVKRFETRPAPPNGDMRPEGVRGLPGLAINAGERIAIHAAAKAPTSQFIEQFNALDAGAWLDKVVPLTLYLRHEAVAEQRESEVWTSANTTMHHMPLGALLGTVEIVRALPIVQTGGEWPDDTTEHITARIDGGLSLFNAESVHRDDDGKLLATFGHTVDISDQLPYGDWQPGRWAWELANVERFDRPIPVKGKQGVWEAAA